MLTWEIRPRGGVIVSLSLTAYLDYAMPPTISDAFATNVIVIAHIAYQDQPDGTKKGFPQGVGQKLSPKIPQYFSSVVLYTNVRDKRTIKTNSTMLVDLANPKPFEMSPELPIETGLATFFETLRGPTTAASADKPKAVILKRRV